jgi:hypothetical protein
MAWTIDGMIRRGDIRNMAEAARLARVSRARMTQVLNMKRLSPELRKSSLRPVWELM